MKLEPPRPSQMHQDPNAKMTQISRRKFLGIATWTLAVGLLPRQASNAATSGTPSEKALAFYNTHTGERLRTVYWAQGNYIGESLGDINRILRDHLANETREIEPKLLDLLYAVSGQLGSREPFHVISGYRSASTNAFLRAHSSGVAENSLHTVGKAIDIRLPGRDLRSLRKVALELKGGGVGFYPKSDFVHVDVGRVRNW